MNSKISRYAEHSPAKAPSASPEEFQLPATLPRVRVPVRIKITLPYMLLAMILAIGAAYIISRVVLDTIEERFTNQLVESGKLTNDWLVQEENRLLGTLRLLAYTQGMPQAVTTRDTDQLLRLALPVAVNYREEAIEILDPQGLSLLSLHHIEGGKIEEYTTTSGGTLFNQWPFVQKIVEQRSTFGRDKYSGLAQTPWGDYFYVAGPIPDEQGRQVGVVLIGKSLTSLVRQIRQDTLSQTTIYDLNGRPLASTLLFQPGERPDLSPDLVLAILERRAQAALSRPLTVASINYTEIVGPWQVRRIAQGLNPVSDEDIPGLVGVSLAQTFLVNPSRITRLQIFLLTTVAFLTVILLGLYLANRITRPLLQVVRASAQVAEGDLDIRVNSSGNDEVAVLAYSFNQMVVGLKEGSLYRDLLGRTVSPEVREQLRRVFASGQVRLEGQEAVATVLISDIQGFTTLSEAEESTAVLAWLNEYYQEIVPVATDHGGVVSTFEGDAVMIFFGILPCPLPAQESAHAACLAALEMLEAITHLNTRRADRNEPPLIAGIGINTGPVTAGALGSTDRLHYTIIGDTVNTTARLQIFTRQFGQVNNAVISQHTLFALGERRHQFNLEPLGAHTIKGKVEQLLMYRLHPLQGQT